MTALADRPATDPTNPNLLARYTALPTPVRWMVTAALAVLVLAIVQSFNDTELLTASNTTSTMLKWSMPILLAGLGGLFSERAGVVNIGLEGTMIFGAWSAAWGATHWGPWGGLIAGLVGGALGGLLHAIATVGFGVDHIVAGVAINILGPGLTRYLSERIFTGMEGGSQTQSPRVDDLGNVTAPILAGGDIGGWRSPDVLGWFEDREWFWISDITGMLRGLLIQVSWFTVIGVGLTLFTSWLLFRTSFGLRLRSAGENPFAGESLGVDIYRYKYIAVTISGALAGLAGSFIVLELTSLYREGQTQGRGFIALAALIFGNYRASGIFAGALLFAYPQGMSFADFSGTAIRSLLLVVVLALAAVIVRSVRQENRVDTILAGVMGAAVLIWYLSIDAAPDWLPNTMPYALVLLVLIFNAQRLRIPKYDGYPYRRGET